MNNYEGFKSQALDFNIYSDGASVESVKQQYALAPKDPKGGPFYDIKEGEGENAVTIWEIDWSDSPPPYTDYPTRVDSSTEITSEGKNVYWERQVTKYSDSDELDYGTATESTMLDVDFINALGITAKKITVLQDNATAASNTNPIIFEADGSTKDGIVRIGGFEVDSNSLSTGGDTAKVILKSTVPSNITLEDIPDTAGGRVGVYRYDGKTYVLLDYIESTGKECIDLDIQANTIKNATLNFMYTGSVADSMYDVVYGTAEGLQIARTETGEFTNGDSASDVELELNKRYVCKATYNVGTIELWTHDRPTGTAIATLTHNTAESTANNVYLFSSGAAYFSKAKIYNCSIEGSSGNHSYNFIPVLQVDTNTPGFYETGTNTFYTNNSGQGGFIAGPIAEVVPRISIALGAEKPNKAPFSVTNTGEVTASKGNIGGFTVTSDSLYSSTDSNTGIVLSTAGDTPVIQAGTNFSVDNTGKIISTSGTIGGFEIRPSRLFGGVTGTSALSKEKIIALYAPILPLEIDFSAESVNPSDPIAFDSASVSSSWEYCADTPSGKTWGSFSPSSTYVNKFTLIRRTSEWTSIKDATLERFYPRWKIESTQLISGVARDENGTELKDDDGNPETVTDTTIENLLAGDTVAWLFGGDVTINLPYVTNTGEGETRVYIKKYIELRLQSNTTSYESQVQYRYVLELTPDYTPWVDATYTINIARAPEDSQLKDATFTVTGSGTYTTKTWTRIFSYTQVPGGSTTASFPLYYIEKNASNLIPEGIVINPTKTGESKTVLLGTRGNSKGYDYTTINLKYDNSSNRFTLTETIDYIVDGNPNPLIVTLTTDKEQDAIAAECALVAGAKVTRPTVNDVWKVAPGTEALRIEHTGRLRLKNGLDFYQTGLSYSGTWGKDSEKSWAASHNAGATTYKWWNTDKGGYDDYWKSFAQLGVNKTYLDNGGLAESAANVDQSPATLFLAASTDATHTNFILPRHYESSAVIRAAATPSYDDKCTAEITLSRYNIPLSTSTTAAPVARTTITPDGINTGYVQFNLPGEVGDVRHYVIWSKDVTNDPRGTWNTISAGELGFSPLVGWISYATSSTNITQAGNGSVLDNGSGVTTSGKNIFYWVSSATNDTNKINRVTLTVIGYL